MLIKFKAKNFRSIKEEIVLDLQATSDKALQKDAVFEIGNIPLLKSIAIYGPNASGKSNVLKAFVTFRAMVLKSILHANMNIDLPNEYFKLNTETENKPSFFEIEFLINKEVFVYGFEIDKEKVCVEWLKQKKGKKILFNRKGQKIDSNKNYFKEATETLKKQTQERVLFLSLLSLNNGPISKKIVQFIQKTNYIPAAERGTTLDFSFGEFFNNPEIAEKMKELLFKINPNLSDIKASEKMMLAKDVRDIPDKFKELIFKKDSKIAQRSLKFLWRKYNKKGEEIGNEPLDYFREESEGNQQIFALSAPLLDTLEKGKILFIDEIDSSLHPVFCRYLISIFNSKKKNPNNAQLIFTTHDVSLLKEEVLRRDQVYFTDKNKQGATKLFSLADMRERKGVDFAKRYLEGRYDAVPYISDLNIY